MTYFEPYCRTHEERRRLARLTLEELAVERALEAQAGELSECHPPYHRLDCAGGCGEPPLE